MGVENLSYIIGSAIGGIVWFIRLEGRVKNCEKFSDLLNKELDALIIKHETLDSKIVEELSRIRESLARLEGSLQMSKQRRER